MSIINPIDFNLVRKTLVEALQDVVGQVCIEEMPETQNAPRPKLPYFSYHTVSPAGKVGDDSQGYVGTQGPVGPTQQFIFERAGQRKMTVDFHAYAVNKDDAWNAMSLWQSSLELPNVQERLRRGGIAVWLNGSVADNSTLLNTGFEGRAMMTVQFGVVQSLKSDLGSIQKVNMTDTIQDDGGNQVDHSTFDIPET